MSLPTSASVVTSGLGAYPTLFFDRQAIDTLKSNLFMYQACDYRTLPDLSGVVIRLWNNTSFTANTTAATEGTPASGQAITENVRDLTLSQYADFASISDKALRTHLTDALKEAAELLMYRGALSVDTVISTAVDTAANSDSATRIEINDGSHMDTATARKAVWGLRSKDVKPKANGQYFGIIPSVMAYDLVNDTAAGGAIDLQKYVDSLAVKNPALVGIQGARIGVIGGVEWYESNALPSETNWQSSANNAYHAYVFGLNAFIAASLADTQLGQKNFTVRLSKFKPGDDPIDGAGLIGATASYNFLFGCVKRPSTVNAFRRVRGEATLG